MPYSVYVLFSSKDKRLYVGCTADIKQRLIRHNQGLVPATKYRRPFILIHEEKFENKTEAFERERFLKSLWGAKVKKKLLARFLKHNFA